MAEVAIRDGEGAPPPPLKIKPHWSRRLAGELATLLVALMILLSIGLVALDTAPGHRWLVDRLSEVEQLPVCGHYGVGVVPYSPLARGVLSGKYDPGTPPAAGTRAARNDPRLMQTEWRPESLEIAQKVAERAKAKGISTVAFAIAWVLRNKFVSSAIVGPRTEEQWDAYLPALEAVLDADDEAFVDALVRPGHASTPGYTDPAYPIEGRTLR